MAETLPERTATTGTGAASDDERLPPMLVLDKSPACIPRLAWIAVATSMAVHGGVICALWSRPSVTTDSLALRSGRAGLVIQIARPAQAAPEPLALKFSEIDVETPEPHPRLSTQPEIRREVALPLRIQDPPGAPAADQVHQSPPAIRRSASSQQPGMPQVQPHRVRQARRENLTSRPPAISSPTVVAMSDPGVQRQQPQPLSSNRPPHYPAEAIAARAEGTTQLRVTVNDAGDVVGLEVKQSSGWSLLDKAAASAVAKWRFEPQPKSIRGGKQTVVIPVMFQLNR